MAIITEHPDEPTTPPPKKSNPNPNPKSESNPNPFHFWFYFTLILSLITLLTLLFSSLTPQDPKAWFLNLPPILRHHYSNGRAIKVQTAPSHPQVEVFTIQRGPVDSGSRVLIVHGVGCSSFAFRDVVGILGRMGVYNVAIDLPGSGFSDKEVVVEEEVEVGGSRGLWEVYEEIKEKGVFWGFDQLVEQGYVDLEANGARVRTRERVKVVEMGGEEMGRVLGQVVDSMGLAPVDLVLHDSAFGLSANWIAENLGLVRSVTVLDGVPSGTALPIWALDVPLVREVVLGFRFVFERVLEKCCVKSVGSLEADAHRILLKGREGRRAVVGMGKNLNCSFDLSEWSGREGVKSLPIRVIWSAGWSDEWTAEGQRIADALPQAKLVTHSGRRWTQAYNAGEVAERIYDFISSLPGTPKQVTEEPIIEHVQKVFSEAETGDHHHHHHHDHGHGGHDHHVDHDHAHTGYADAYGLGHNWAM